MKPEVFRNHTDQYLLKPGERVRDKCRISLEWHLPVVHPRVYEQHGCVDEDVVEDAVAESLLDHVPPPNRISFPRPRFIFKDSELLKEGKFRPIDEPVEQVELNNHAYSKVNDKTQEELCPCHHVPFRQKHAFRQILCLLQLGYTLDLSILNIRHDAVMDIAHRKSTYCWNIRK